MSNYSTTATAILQMNTQQVKAEIPVVIDRINKLKKALADAAAEGKTGLAKQLRKDLREAQRELKLMESAVNDVKRVMDNLDKASPKQLQAALRQLNRELQNMERGSAAWNEQVKKIQMVKAEISSVNKSLVDQGSLWERFSKKLFLMGNAIFAVQQAFVAVSSAAKEAVKAYADMDQEMANVRKYTGMTADEVEHLNEEFKTMDTRSSREQLNQLAQEAGRLGMQSQEDVMGFVRASDKINVALDELGEGATLTLSKLTDIFGDRERLGVEKSLLAVGSVINELSQNSTASAGYLAEFGSRLGGVGAQAGMTTQQIMGYGAVLDSYNQKVEASSTALSQVIVRLYREPAKYAQVAGLDVQRFTELLKTDANAALIMFLETLNKAGGMDVLSPMFADMGENGARAIQALSTLALHIDEVKLQQDAANKAFAEANSIDKEFEVQNNTAQATLEKRKKYAHELAVELGERLMPLMGHVYTTSGAIMRLLNVMVEFIAEYRWEIVGLAASYAGYVAAVKLATVAVKADTVAKVAARVATAAWTAVTQLAYAAMALLQLNVRKATMEMRIFAAVIHASPIGLLVAGITAACAGLAIMVKRYGDNVRAATEAANKQREYLRSLRDIDSGSKAYSENELARLKALYSATVNETLARDKRIEAAKRMQALYPEVFANFSTEEIMAGKAKNAYDQLTDSIIRNARARAAAEKILENEKAILDLEEENRKLRDENKTTRDEVVTAGERRRQAQERDDNRRAINQDVMVLDEGILELDRTIRQGVESIDKNVKVIRGNYKKIKERREANEWLQQEYNVTGTENTTNGSPAPVVSYVPKTPSAKAGGGSSGNSRGGKEDKFAAENAWREREEALNKIAWRQGEKNYEEYQNRQLKIAVLYEEKRLEHTDLTENERLKIQALKLDAERKQMEQWHNFDLEDEEKYYKERLASLQESYAQDYIDAEAYHGKMKEYELEHLRMVEQITKNRAEARIREWEEAVKSSAELMKEYQGNVDLLNRPVVDAYELTKKGWSGNPKEPGTGEVATVYSSQYGIEDSEGKVREILVTPILPDGSVLSEKELEDYINNKLQGASDILAADEKRIVIAVDVDPDGSAGQRLHELQEYYYAPQPGPESIDEAFYEQYLKAHEEYQKKLIQDQEEKQKQYQQNLQRHAEKMKEVWNQYFVTEKEKRASEYEAAKTLVDQAYQEEIAKEGYTAEEKLEIERRYQAALRELKKKFLDENQGDKKLEDWAGEALDKIFGEGTWDEYGQVVMSMYNSIASAFDSLNKMAEAENQIRISRLEKYYEREISMAEGNAYKVQQLERRKERQIAKIKADSAKKQYAQQVMAAIAGTATAAINAYASAAKEHWLLGAVAAAMAVAAGSIQIAAIRKQQQASLAQGYAEGGFTPKGRPDEPVGVVHAGEWVASQRLLQNPQARAAIETLDYAQRNNAYGVIEQADVTRQLSAPTVIAGAASDGAMMNAIVTVAAVLGRYSDTMQKLGDRLNEPFVTINTITGDAGQKKAQDDYISLMNNTLPKNKRK